MIKLHRIVIVDWSVGSVCVSRSTARVPVLYNRARRMIAGETGETGEIDGQSARLMQAVSDS